MLDDKRSKEELIDELKRSKILIDDLKADLASMERSKDQFIKNERFLSQTAMELVEMPFEADIYEFTAKKLKKLFKNSIVMVTSYNDQTDLLGLGAIQGIDNKTVKILNKFLGKNFMDNKVRFSEMDEELQKPLFHRQLTLIEKGLYNATGAIFPEKACSTVEKLVGVTGVYNIGLIWEGKLYGTVTIFMKNGDVLDKKEILETLTSMVSVALQKRRAEKIIKKALEEKEMLMKEIHHRVKNNLMVISSLLGLQSKYIKDKTALNVFKESQDRARAMALIHDLLYNSKDLKRINFGKYVEYLTEVLYNAYIPDPGLIKMNLNVEYVMLDVNTVIPLGLIVNELVSNCIKYAFPNDTTGEIDIYFHKKDDAFILKVIDDGNGFPEDLDFHETETFGLRLIKILVKQLNGTIKLDKSKGTQFEIEFNELYPERK